MGNKCNCVSSQSTDEAEDALLGGEDHQQQQQHRPLPVRQVVRRLSQTPRGPPPPYQQVHPFYMLTEEQRLHIVARLTLIQSLPVGQYEWRKGEKKPSLEKEKCDKSGESRECPICMNDFLPGDPIRLLPCMHYYHIRCIDEWLMRASTCPNCMQRVDLAFQRSASFHNQRVHRRSCSRGSINSSHGTTPTPTGFSASSRNNSSDLLQSPSHVSTSPPPPLTPPLSPLPSVSPQNSSTEVVNII